MKNIAKLSCFFLSFLSFCSITPSENAQSLTTSIQSYLQCLEPANPSVPRIVGIPNIIVDGASLFFSYNKSLNFFSYFQFIVQANNLLSSDSFIKEFSNVLMLNSTTYSFNFINYIIPGSKYQSVAINICKGICALVLPLIAQYNNPNLFTTDTYLNFLDISYENPFLMPFYLTAHFHITSNPNSLIAKISQIFDAKQTMFLIAIILACFNIKLKSNKILTNPAYWLSIGIAHLLFNNYRFTQIKGNDDLYSSAAKFFWKTRSFFKVTDFTTYKCNALHYACCNAIPISAVLISAMIPV